MNQLAFPQGIQAIIMIPTPIMSIITPMLTAVDIVAVEALEEDTEAADTTMLEAMAAAVMASIIVIRKQ